ncbi:MAG: class I SAM-dependent methyltransferase [Rhodoferax sp.]|uniref:class I SAM-dependent methyltransferase n=1 Tax=Rhodoferax sp. TaxID=50421 RepID=UPI002ACDDC5B|nr:class I SAM-dependent methyltransferase [Rhodoferax sp.]MDZ7891007.1 class I SAM-dependent methyltransferase [Rhodoferax sp.]
MSTYSGDMGFGSCRLCGNASINSIFGASIFDVNINYFDCAVCSYVQTEQPHWLDRAYESAINNCDTGIMARNLSNIGLVLATLSVLNRASGTVVDCAGGYGILVRLLRDRGVEALWSDPYCENLLAVGFEHTTEKAELVTAFEAFEHFVDPLLEVEKLFAVAPNLLISTSLIATPAPLPDKWWYYGLDHGQHIGFFRLQTLQFIAEKFNKHMVTDGVGYHLFTDKPISATEWNLKARVARRMPSLFSRKLRSKIWSDFEKMSAKS